MGERWPVSETIRILAGRVIFSILLAVTLCMNPVLAQDQTDVVRGKWLMHYDLSNSLYKHLTGQAVDLLIKRTEAVSAIRTPSGWMERQQFIEDALSRIMGPFPEKTPLNAKVVRVIKKENYRIEHVIFESQPGFFVTSSLFIPDGVKKDRKTPAVIYCSGHSEEGYRSKVYLHVILNLVKKGFIVLAFDPVGQGERLEYYDPETGLSSVGGPTREHSYPGAQAFISGSSQAYHMVWDGIRAVDYLLERKEIDPARIGITGRSGGGTQSAYIAAFDKRIHAAAPENYITNYTRLLQSIGPQDAEQNLFNLISAGLDHPDFLIVRAPKPALMITTSEDMFSIQGAVETEREVSAVYKALGHEENFSRVEDDAGHASTMKNREAMYAFFQQHLGQPGDSADETVQLPLPEEMLVTATGQVSSSLRSHTVFSLNREISETKLREVGELRENSPEFTKTAVNSAIRLSGYIEPVNVEKPVFTGRIIREGYVVEKYFVRGEGDYVIPYLLFRPERNSGVYLVYLHPDGKKAESSPGGEIEKFVKNGYIVMAPDLPGTGEARSDTFRGDAYFDGVSHNLWYLSMLTGRSITGILAGDIARLAAVIKSQDNKAVICGFALKEMGIPMVHSAAFTGAFESVTLVEPLASFSSIVMNRFYNHKYIPFAVPGSLMEYDLPDLAASLAPSRLIIAGMVDGNGKRDDKEGIIKAGEIIGKGYVRNRVPEMLQITEDIQEENLYRMWHNNK
ncbi:MAG: acetylxylan esterase [Bacteroidales bacterium]|jgi:hypothetical protein|nr:acetylxylan esterase [Bacteroidales bacterium]